MESIGNYYSYVKRLGQWHLFAPGGDRLLCGMSILGFNYYRDIPPNERTKCCDCFAEVLNDSNNGKKGEESSAS